MNWLISLVSNKYNRLDSNSELFKNNHRYFEELNRQLEDKRKEKSFSSLIGLLSFYKVVSKCQKCINLVDEFLLFIDTIKRKLEGVEKSYYKNILLKDIDIYQEKFQKVLNKPIYDIYQLLDYLSFKKKSDSKQMMRKVDEYLTLEKKILDYIEIINDENTQLENITKNNFKITLNDYYHLLTIDNYNDTKNKFTRLKKDIEKAIDEEKVRIKIMSDKVDVDILELNNILKEQDCVLHPKFQNEIEDLQHRLIQIKVEIADSKYVLGKYYILKNEVYLISKKYDHLKFRSDLLEKTKDDAISILNSHQILNKSDEKYSQSINRIKSLPKMISQEEIDSSFKLCEDSKKSVYNM